MIIKRKLFTAHHNNLDNRLGYYEFRERGFMDEGPWDSEYTEFAKKELDFSPNKDLIEKIRKHINKFPTMIGGPYRQHPLWNFYDAYKNEFVVWSARITQADRFIYLIFKGNNKIWITNLAGHRVFDVPYSDTSRENYNPESLGNSDVKIGKDGRVITPKKNKHKKKK